MKQLCIEMTSAAEMGEEISGILSGSNDKYA